jgi:arylsulfatase
MKRKPNILWICTDQQRWDTVNSLGNPLINTPNVDSLVKAGTAFTNAYTQSPICTPSRVSFLTGLYPATHQVSRNGNDYFPSSLPLVTGILADNGYHGGLIGKLHLSRSQGKTEIRPENDGYAEYYWSHYPYPEYSSGHDYEDWLKNEKGVKLKDLLTHSDAPYGQGVQEEYHQTRWATERAKGFIKKNKDKPWFLSINVFDPHPPFDPPESYKKRYDPEKMPYPIFAKSDIEHQNKFLKIDQQTKIAVDPTKYDPSLGLFGDKKVDHSDMHWMPPTNYDSKVIRACYYAMIELIDDMVGEFLELLEKSGQREDTLIIFMSDHGEMLGDHGLLYKGCRFYEGLVHVPLIFSYPGIIRDDLQSEALAELVDLPPTILELAGLEIPKHMQGQSLVPILSGESDPIFHKDCVVTEYNDSIVIPGGYSSHGSMYFDGRYKICVYHDMNIGEIYDLKEDPDEFNDLWLNQSYQDLKADLVLKHFNAMMNTVSAGVERSAKY